MQHVHRPAVRRTAAFGATIAIVSAASAFGLGATSATAESAGPEAPPTSTSTATATPTSASTAAATATATPAPAATPTPTATPTDTATPAAPPASTPAAAPAATATPAATVAVTGTPRAWRTLTATTSGWPAGTTFTYAWHFRHPVVIDSRPATDRTYVVDPELADATVTVSVTGTAPGATPTTVTSAPTAPVVVDQEEDLRFIYGSRVVSVTPDEPFSVSLSPAPNPDLRFFANGSIGGGPDPSALPTGVTLSEDGVLSGTLHRSPSEDFWVHVSTPFHPGGGLSERILLSAIPEAGDGDGAGSGSGTGTGTGTGTGDVAGSSPESPLRLEATAGEAFSHDFAVDTAPGEDARYTLRSPAPELADDPLRGTSLRFDQRTGVLSGSDTAAGLLSLSVDTTVGDRTTTRYVELTVRPGATTGLQVWLTPVGDPQLRDWKVDQDGTVTETVFPHGGPGRSTTVSRPSVPQSSTLDVRATPVDRWGNFSARYEDLDGDGSAIRSDVRSDVATDVVTADGAAVRVRFPHASTHTLTISRDGATAVVPITVVPRDGQLAFTGADTTAPLAASGGLLAVGAALLLHRARRHLRRRRA